ncbi:MAG: tripartite tricarboxylate transporter substrate binding protein [Burkholderiales bacterium]|nr:tripartite tricarboxylate transporter substrate binding protein [Burkholderiales bacterium]
MQLVRVILSVAGLLLCASVAAQSYSSRPVTILNGFPPGGPTDTVLRLVGTKLSERLGQPVVIENRAGAAGTIAGTAVARAEPDGHTLLFGVAANLAVAPATMSAAPYDPAKAFAAIIEVARGPYIWMVKPDVPAASMQEFLAWARRNPGKVNYGSPGQGSVHHLASEMLKQATGVDMTHVPYKGGATAYIAMLGGEIDAMFDSLPAPLAHIRAGKIRALAVTGPKRLTALPQVPTLAEQGVAGLDVHFWWGFVGPAGLPSAVVARLNTEIGRALADPELKATFAKWDIEPSPGTSDAFGAYIAQESARWRAFVAKSNFKL